MQNIEWVHGLWQMWWTMKDGVAPEIAWQGTPFRVVGEAPRGVFPSKGPFSTVIPIQRPLQGTFLRMAVCE